MPTGASGGAEGEVPSVSDHACAKIIVDLSLAAHPALVPCLAE